MLQQQAASLSPQLHAAAAGTHCGPTVKLSQSCDVLVDVDGVMYITDTNAGLYILQFEGE